MSIKMDPKINHIFKLAEKNFNIAIRSMLKLLFIYLFLFIFILLKLSKESWTDRKPF